MMDKVVVDVGLVKKFKDYLAWVNSHPLDQLELVDCGKPVKVAEDTVEEFRFIGLSNTDFIWSEWYKPFSRLNPSDVCPLDCLRSPCSPKCIECDFCVGNTFCDKEYKEVKCSYDKYNNNNELRNDE
jgi:hypothetical protein